MLKKNALRRICISTFSLFIVLLLCIFPSNETSYPEEIISINELTMPLYIKDQNGYVARTNIIKKKDNDIEYIRESAGEGVINNASTQERSKAK